MVRLTARRADVLVVPCTAMAERVSQVLPRYGAGSWYARTRSRPTRSRMPRDPAILCPVLFAPYKRMDERLAELLAAVDDSGIRRSGCG